MTGSIKFRSLESWAAVTGDGIFRWEREEGKSSYLILIASAMRRPTGAIMIETLEDMEQ